MPSSKLMALAAMAFAAVGTASHAQAADKWFGHFGPALVAPHESASMAAGGAPVPGANVSIDDRYTVEGEIGRYLTRNIAVAVAAGLPPKFTVDAAGTLTGLGTAGKMTGGPAGLLLQYHFNRDGKIQPYIGAGASFLVVFDTEDGVLTNLKARSAVGTALQAGADIMLDDRLGLFVDVKKAYVETVAKGMLGAAPVRAKVKVDPLVTNIGVTYHF